MLHSHIISYMATIMALNIRNSEAEQLAERIAVLTGETKTAAVLRALRERYERLQRERSGRSLADRLDEIARHSGRLPILDSRLADEIIGYDDDGLPL
jgi:antitoxin VapB